MNIYQVTNTGAGKMWRITDRSKGGAVVGFASSFTAAVAKAEQMEAKLRICIEHLIESRKAA